MSSPYPPQPPKRLERSKSNRIVGGVCAGVANYLNMDPTLVRVLTVVISLFTGVPVILYIVALFVMPEEGSQPNPPNYPPVGGPQAQAGGYSPTPQQTAPPRRTRPPPRRQVPRPRSLSRQQPVRFRPMTPSGAARARPGNNASPLRSRLLRSRRLLCRSHSRLVHPSRRRRSCHTPTRKTLLNRHLSLRGRRSVPPTARAPQPRAHPKPKSAQPSEGGQQTDRT